MFAGRVFSSKDYAFGDSLLITHAWAKAATGILRILRPRPLRGRCIAKSRLRDWHWMWSLSIPALLRRDGYLRRRCQSRRCSRQRNSSVQRSPCWQRQGLRPCRGGDQQAKRTPTRTTLCTFSIPCSPCALCATVPQEVTIKV